MLFLAYILARSVGQGPYCSVFCVFWLLPCTYTLKKKKKSGIALVIAEYR